MSSHTSTPPAPTGLLDDRLDALRALFPEAFAEGKVDFDKLRAALGDHVETAKERYAFTWAGKTDAIRTLQAPTSGTLIPAPDESVNWDTTQNLFIEGDNLEVLKLLYRAYFGKVKLIYIDPPYNTGGAFTYPDDYSEPLGPYLRLTGQMNGVGTHLTSNPEASGRVHSNWLNMMYPRLFVGRQLLRDDGMIFVSIDDNEVHSLRLLMNELFGEENHVATLVWKSRQNVDSRNQTRVSKDHEYIVAYSKTPDLGRLRGKDIDRSKYGNPDDDPRGPWMSNSILGLANATQRPNLHYTVTDPTTGLEYQCPPDTGWRYSRDTMARKIGDGRIVFPASSNGRPREKKYLAELESEQTGFSSVLGDSAGFTFNGSREVREIMGDRVFDFPKPVSLIRTLCEQGLGNTDDIVLDFFAGSGTTGQAVLDMNRQDGGNRRFILVQLPEPTGRGDFPTIADIGKERIRRVIKKLTATQPKTAAADAPAPDLGFRVFKLAPSHLKHWSGVVALITGDYLLQLDAFDNPFVNTIFDQHALVWELAILEGFPPPAHPWTSTKPPPTAASPSPASAGTSTRCATSRPTANWAARSISPPPPSTTSFVA